MTFVDGFLAAGRARSAIQITSLTADSSLVPLGTSQCLNIKIVAVALFSCERQT